MMIRSIINSFIKKKTCVVTEEIDRSLKNDQEKLSNSVNNLLAKLIEVKRNGLLPQETDFKNSNN